MLSYLLAACFGAVWRLIDGGSDAPKHWHLTPIPFILVAGIVGGWQLGLALVVAYASLLDGFRGWHDFGYMKMRYTGYAALTCALASVSLWYIPLAFFAGLTYPTLHWLDSKGFKTPVFWKFDGYNRYCEVVCGAAMFGGALL